jgi:CRP-like cAMP-binding protein
LALAIKKDIERINEILNYNLDPIIYVRCIENSFFYLILSGEVMVCSGHEGFLIKMGPYNYLGLEALTQKDYRPDFSAKVINQARLLKIRREDYQKYLLKV